ncbi:alpha/beta hydrolase [Sphaerisporangium melleum]|uniref:Alpha/beta hydrolase n=1 Tax=Sphaerisporangium melleum TaxID=321316 RepID=A0A917QYI8_9ACTN|nr:alpha/beta hydrolase [Sphaerisporangium melleum]GGK75228.1 alpha/beta hydrolase [Sphaerisporangium melleum]GII72606.1 alpha/beta hydrolase [Sphaerisporangium melleum]
MRTRPTVTIARLLAGLALLALTVVPALPAEAASGVSCRLVSVPETVAGTPVTLRGTLCRPSGPAPATVQMLLAGATFDQAYWLTPATAGARPYATAMAEAGYAVLALDRPGTGLSGRAAADALTLSSEVELVHDVVTRLRTGTVDGTAYRRVVGVGHSFGSSVLVTDAARHATDLDAVVATGFVHSIGPRLDALNAALVPAAGDPVLGVTHPPAGYLTTKPGSRAGLFLDPAGAAPAMAAVIELTKTTMTTGEQATLAEAGDPSISGAVRVPVLVAVGEHDDLFCNGPYLQCTDAAAVTAWESWFYPAEARLSAFVLPGAGHALNLHRNAPELFTAIRTWLTTLPA